MTTSDTDWEAELERVVARIGQLQELYDRVYDARAGSTSLRAADDRATWPLAIGQHVQYCLVQAIDMCQGIAELVANDTGLQIPLAASYPLSRAAIESSSMAAWMLIPATRRERVLRRLQVAQDELSYEKAFIHCVAYEEELSKQMRMKRVYAKDAKRTREQMREIARVNDIQASEYANMPGWEEVVKQAAVLLTDSRPSLLTAAWRFTSGLTHPSFTRGRIAHEFVRVNTEADDAKGEITGNIEWIVSTAAIAESLTRKAIKVLRFTKVKVNGERPVPDSRTGV
ncbi:hypothetical protein [Microbacterium sp. Bi128]|uniref:hypothetical protein n=1 Tax=Microbacterium sp. Bi128 TaxID=2821115 RepID=UPI001E39311D|nr:hypothetical protein [Microbacterium sp. Bi128]